MFTFNVSFSQNNSMRKTMNDSLYKTVYNFFGVLGKTIVKDKVTKNDINNFLTYVYEHMRDTVQSSEDLFPEHYSKSDAIKLLKTQVSDLIGKKCKYIDGGWDGWDGRSPYTAYRFDIEHDNYSDQFVMVLSTKNEITCIYSFNSK